MICIPIVATTEQGIVAEMAAAAKSADLVELRMDYAPGADIERLLANRPCPVIVTNRPVREGGRYDGPEEERLALLQRAVALGAEYVDVELDSVTRIRRGERARLIVSHHDFDATPANLEEIHARIVRSGADIAKLVCMATDIRDNLRMFSMLRSTKHPTIALCMGEQGLISRILGRKFGNALTFASLAAGKESAPGQISAADLRDLYHYQRVGRDTAVYGVIGNPVAHSMSPAILNAAFREAGLNAVYVPFKVECDVVEFVNAFRELEVMGYSVTIPHKQRVITAMEEVDAVVEKTGAMNTVVNREGRLFGANTDLPGALKALENAAGGEDALRGKRVLLLGAGGAARALAFGLISRGASLVIANRTHERGVKLAGEVGCECCRLADIASCDADILVNTTAVGMYPKVEATPVPREALKPGMLVFDAVYNPPETRLLREAEEAGCKTVSGVAWFVNQAALQFELWTDLPAPRGVIERVLRERLGFS